LELLAAAKENKVKLFIPSEFGSDAECNRKIKTKMNKHKHKHEHKQK